MVGIGKIMQFKETRALRACVESPREIRAATMSAGNSKNCLQQDYDLLDKYFPLQRRIQTGWSH